ncbi:MAG: dockerin type I repeat-containing protein, partial [Planctomycetales bacterium]|nr:dockerin type I repeat-containing protein [Planctomycetales bacterium]
LLYYDPFLIGSNPAAGEYTVGPLAPNAGAGGGGQNPVIGPTPFLTGPWERRANDDAPNGLVQEEGLSFLGAPSLGGASSSSPNSRQGRYLSTPWGAATTGTYYLSYLINYGSGDYSDGTDNNDMGFRAVEFWGDNAEVGNDNTAVGFVGYNAYYSAIGPAQQNPRTARMTFAFNGHQIVDGSPNSFLEEGSTHLVVLKFILSDQDASDAILMYLDPADSDEPVIPAASVTNVNFTLGAIGSTSIFGGTGTFPVFDELRIGTSYIDVLPEFPLKGDTNGDGLVDLVDYEAIFSHLNLSGQSTLNGDVTGDGRVDLRDLRLWRDHRTDGSAELPSSFPTPEPSSLVLALLAAAGWSRRRQA